MGKVLKKLEETRLPWQKSPKTARWARIMTKWAITHSGKAGVKWKFVEFGGSTGAESRGIVDILAIRKNHKEIDGLKRGDLFDIVLIQTKGGSARRPSDSDVQRLCVVAKYYHAKAIVLAEWKIGEKLNLYRLVNRNWMLVKPAEIFE